MSYAPGCVYVLRVTGTDLYKIGFSSRSPSARLHAIVAAGAPPLEFVAAVRSLNAKDAEAALHWLTQSHRAEREWFHLTADHLTDVLFALLSYGVPVDVAGNPLPVRPKILADAYEARTGGRTS